MTFYRSRSYICFLLIWSKWTNAIMRRYPWGIHRLVSTHSRGGILGNSKLKVSSHDKIFIFSWGEGVFLATQNSKSQVLTKFSFRGGGILDTTFLKYFSRGTQGILHQNFTSLACSCIADSLSHTTCVEANELSVVFIFSRTGYRGN